MQTWLDEDECDVEDGICEGWGVAKILEEMPMVSKVCAR
jgi:hypothetical protein